MNLLQPIDELERFWADPDPWKYENNPDDLNRRAMLLSAIPKRRYERVLDIGCGNGFVTTHLPGSEIVGVDVSANALGHARRRSAELPHISYEQHSVFDLRIPEWRGAFDLIIITGVLYPQYIAHSERLVYLLIDDLLKVDGCLVACHIDEWYAARFPYITLMRDYYPYREYVHVLETYRKT